MTFSLVARCPSTGQFGVVISSSSPAVAARCAHARSRVGAVATQNVTDPRLGPRALRLLDNGATASETTAILARTAAHAEYRQLLVVGRDGDAAIHSGPRALGLWSGALGEGAAAGGNLLADRGVPAAMVASFSATSGDLGDRLIAALLAGLSAGGEAGPVRSAGLLVVDDQDWPLTDLRVDWDDNPVAHLADLWALWKPQAAAYVTRALNPGAAPSYGVPGDR